MQVPQYSADATKGKCQRIGLEVGVQHPRAKSTTSELEIPKELPPVEKAMKIFAGPFERVRVRRTQLLS